MAFDPLPTVIKTRIPKPTRVLPPSSFVGLALPLAALGIVLIGMNLHIFGLTLWAAAMALVGFALERKYAIAVAALIAGGGMLFWQWVIGSAKVYAETEQLSFVLATILAWSAGQLGAMVLNQEAAMSADQVSLRWYEDMIRAIFAGSRDCIKLIAEDGTVLAINDHGLKLIGATRESQMIGHHWFDFWGSDQRKSMLHAWNATLANGVGEFSGNCRILTGERRTWHNTFTRVQLPGSSDISILCVSRDITAMQRTQQSLKESVAQLNGLLNSISDAFLAIDSHWTITFMNRYCIDMFKRNGVDGEPGNNFWQVVRDDANPTSAAIRQTMATRQIQHSEYFFESRSTWFSLTAFPTDGGGVGLFVRDVSALKLAERQIEEEHARLLVAQDIAGYGDWSFDYGLGEMRLSQRAVTMLELGECPAHEYKKRLLERLHSQDRMALVQAIINSSVESPRIDLTVRMPNANGSDRHFHWVGQLIVGPTGEPTSMFGAVQDVTMHVAMLQPQDKTRKLVREIIDVLPQRICVIDKNARFVTANQLWRQDWADFHGDYPMPDDFFAAHALSKRAEEAQISGHISRYLMAVREMISGARDFFEDEYDAPLRDGSVRHYIVQAVPLVVDDERFIVFSHSDITSIAHLQHTLSENERAMHALAENLEEIFWVCDVRERRMTHISSAFERIFKTSRDTILRDPNAILNYVHPDDHAKFFDRMNNFDGSQSIERSFEFRIIDAEGQLHWLNSHRVFLRDRDNEITYGTGTLRDITDYKLREENLYRVAYRDDLTDLPNRKALLLELERRVAVSATQPFAMLLINLDRFKNVNDTLGHTAGDELLRLVGQRLQQALGENTLLARIGGDEFAAICALENYQHLARKALQSFDIAFKLTDEEVFVTGSIGIALCPEHSSDVTDLLKFSALAQRRAKTSGRNTLQIFQSGAMLPNRDRLALENDLRGALARREFVLFYQGKFNLADECLIGAEALLRWHSPSRGMVMPGDFIPLLEETGLILPVGEWVLREACRQAQQWRKNRGNWLPIAVNVSALQFANRQFTQMAAAALHEYAIPRDVIELEITESALMADIAHGAHTIDALKQAGFRIALDDFGTGYSSFGYLRTFAPDTLKIDRSFVADLAVIENDIEIVAGILQLAHALKIDVVAEGVEEAKQRDLLIDLGCEYGQGYLMGKPMPIEQFELSLSYMATEVLPRARAGDLN